LIEGWELEVSDKTTAPADGQDRDDRRDFLKRCGRFAAVTPPAMALLLSVASVPTQARASTIGWGGGGNSQGGNNNSQH
jgi:hypothetical protein